MQKKIFNILIFAPMVFLFLPAFAIYIPFLKGVYMVFFLSLYLAIVLMFLKEKKNMILKMKLIYRLTSFKYFVIAFALIILNSLTLSLFRVTPIMLIMRSIIMQLFLCIFPIMIYFMYIIDTHISYEKFMRVFIFSFWIYLIIGFVAYIGQYFDITIINNIFDFFANQRVLSFKLAGTAELTEELSNYQAFGLPRLDNLFAEPAWYGRFLCLFLPLSYFVSTIKIKLFKNIVLDKVIKKTIVPFTILSIILTLSPIYLIMMFIITAIIYLRQITKFMLKYNIFVLTLFILIFIYVLKFDLSETYLSRIITLFTDVHSFEDFVEQEPSLATRIVSYINSFRVFLNNMLFGVGIGQLGYRIGEMYYSSPVPLTFETIYKSKMYLPVSGQAFFNKNYICTILAENGIIVFSLFVLFIYKLFNELRYLCRKFQYELSYSHFFAISLIYIFISLVIALFYDMYFIDNYLYFIFAISIAFIYRNKIPETMKQQKEA